TKPVTTSKSPTTTSQSSSTTSRTSTSTLPANGVATPAPIQDGMTGNCNKFYKVEVGQTCATTAALYSISSTRFIQWNPAAKSDCTGLWASTYACVGVINGSGGTPVMTSATPANGVQTPTPTHPGMVTNCNKFTKVNPGDTCNTIAFFNGPIRTENFVVWSAGVGGMECKGLQAGTYVCVGVIEPSPVTVVVHE
ncbi:hypothetical protein C8A05DRAFT_12620, partial [Staphylotrichum tortipilum]